MPPWRGRRCCPRRSRRRCTSARRSRIFAITTPRRLAHYERAATLARAAGDLRGLTRALAGRVHAQFTVSSVGYGERIDTAELESAAARLADEDPVLTGFAYSEIAQALWTSRDSERAHAMAGRALALGEHAGADFLCAEAHRALALVEGQRMRVTSAIDHLERGLAAAERTGDTWLVSQLAQRLPFFHIWPGSARPCRAVGARRGAAVPDRAGLG